MAKKSLKNLMMLVLSVSLVIGVVLAGGCVGKEIEAPTQIIEDITPQEALTLIQDNQDNPNFVIIDVQTPGEFAEEHIENAINIDFHSETFQDELNKLDKNRTYLIYSRNGSHSGSALDMMAELDFSEVYNMSGGINEWVAEGLPTIQETPTQISENITPQEAFTLIQDNQDNPDFVIIDIRTPEEFAEEHIENAINLDFRSETFRDELNKLDKDKTYLIYYSCLCGRIGEKTVDIMAELDFSEVYNMSAGLDKWVAEGLPTIQEIPPQIIESITPEEAFTLIQDNQDNPNFVIIDVQTPGEFAEEHIENAINIDFHSETFQDELNKLDKNRTYLIYSRNGSHSGSALDMMAELDFSEVYNMSGGINEWVAEGLPTIQETPTQISENITPQEAFTLIQDNQDNPDFVIIDIRTPEEFAGGHIEDAINIDYRSETFRDELNQLDKDKTYLIYYSCACGRIGEKTLDIMAELNFKEVYNMRAGLDKWEAEGFPTTE